MTCLLVLTVVLWKVPTHWCVFAWVSCFSVRVVLLAVFVCKRCVQLGKGGCSPLLQWAVDDRLQIIYMYVDRDGPTEVYRMKAVLTR